MRPFAIYLFAAALLLTVGCNRPTSGVLSPESESAMELKTFAKKSVNRQEVFIKGKNGGWFRQTTQQKADGTLYLKDGAGKTFVRAEYEDGGYLMPEWFGARGDGETDDYPAFERAITAACETGASFVTQRKKYSLSRRIEFPSCFQEGMVWTGNGAELNNTVYVKSPGTTIRDVSVVKSPAEGFVWYRGQGGHFENLTAKGCQSAGFRLGGEKGSQVAWSTFVNLKAINNQDGLVLDGSFPKCWVNANTFTGIYSRLNSRYGVHLKGKANYNTWMGLHCEGNSRKNKDLPAMLIENSSENTFMGGQQVTHPGNPSPVVVDRGRLNNYFGGRYVADKAAGRIIQQSKSKIEGANLVPRKSKQKPKDK
ncbi:hypothetical protein [Neolewinella agarilytica]|uniref:Pectate lyase superfamily protein n=1 Tax=Neolewinella agarilytica TaxID=478744 RepID=A0A1H9DYP6_9BACT|nr:hypothetical protein [Neolewinella agarilytica]SEQ18640.1 hypothetical protein SAMN05444359_106185 [Neolewinella agarilytica]